MNEYAVTNEISPSWTDVEVTITPADGPVLEATEIESISSGSNLELGVDSNGGIPVRTTTGKLSHEAAMTVTLQGALKFFRALKDVALSKGYRRGKVVQISKVFFTVEYRWVLSDNDDELYVRRLKSCRLLSDSDSASNGTDSTKVELKFHVGDRVKVVDGEEVGLI